MNIKNMSKVVRSSGYTYTEVGLLRHCCPQSVVRPRDRSVRKVNIEIAQHSNDSWSL